MGWGSGWLSIATVLLVVTPANAQQSKTVERAATPATPVVREQANARLPSSPSAAKTAAEQAKREPSDAESDYEFVDLADTQVSNYKTEPSERLPEAAAGAEVPVHVKDPAGVGGGTPAEPVRPAGAAKEPSRLRERDRVYTPITECLESIAGGSRAPSSRSEAAQAAAENCRRR
jgi:hypothetical protein